MKKKKENASIKQEAALFIDIDNIVISFENEFGYRIDFKRVIDNIKKFFNVPNDQIIAIGNMDKFDKKIIENIRNQGIHPRKTEHKDKKNSADAEISYEIYEKNYYRPDQEIYIIMTGDGDFRKVSSFLGNALNKKVIIYAVRNTLSKSLRGVNAQIWYLDAIVLKDIEKIAKGIILNASKYNKDVFFTPLKKMIMKKLRIRPDKEKVISEKLSKLIDEKRLIQDENVDNNGNIIRPIKLPEGGIW